MATYYIDPSGSDSTGNGSIGTPWKTLYKACSTVTSSGNTIHVNAGTYTETVRCTLAVGVNLIGEGDTSIITSTLNTNFINYGPNSSNGDAIVNLTTSGSVVDGSQSISYLKWDGASLTSSHALYIMNRSNVKIHHCTFVDFNYCAVVWWANPNSQTLTGSEFYSNTVTDCAGYNSQDASYYGALYCGSHTGMLIYDNTIVCDGHSAGDQGWPLKFWLWDGQMKGCKIYNNWLEKTDYSVWDFAIESNNEDGLEIYNNTIRGGVDLNHQTFSGDYDYSVWIHDNTIGPPADVAGMYNSGITLEHENVHVIVERNLVQNCSPGVLFTPRVTTQEDVIIRYNVFKNLSSSAYYNSGITINPGGAMNVNGMYIYNNVLHANGAYYGIRMTHTGTGITCDNFRIINNIIEHFGGAPVYFTAGSTLSNVYIRKNIFYDNGNSNNPLMSSTPNPYYSDTPIKTNPLFTTDGSDFTLQSGSPARDAGEDLGLITDYLGYSVPYNTIPDIGAYEYGASVPIPVTSITVSGEGGASTITVDDGTLQLSASILPVDASIQTVTWSITNGTGSGSISVGGLVTAITDGTVTARATAQDGSGVYDDFEITISNQVGDQEIGSFIFITKIEIL